MARLGRFAALAVAALLVGAPGQAKPSPERPDAKVWIDGPVRYIATADEVKMFRSLSTDAERGTFIDAFWRRRDPTRDTPENEYRRLFWSRVKEANDHFTESATPGWKTDRGRIHILCGPPSRIEDSPNADLTRTAPTAGHGLLRWIYEGRPCGRTDVGPEVIIAFAQSVTGDYQLSYDPRLSGIHFDAHDLTDPSRLAIERWLDLVAPPDRSALGVMMDLGKLQEVPHPEEILLDRVETIETYGSHPLAVEVDRFQHPRGGTLVVITVPVPGDSSSVPSLMARLASRDASQAKRFLTEESFRIEGTGADRLAQARIALDPGTWDLTVLSAESGKSTSGLYRGVVEVRGAPEGLRLSDVVLARTLEPLPYTSLFSYDEPYLVGAFRVVPRAGTVVRRGDTVTLFHEVYGGTAPFKVSYQLEGKEDDGRFTPLGRSDDTEQAAAAQGWSIPVGANWPLGDYRVEIRVEDSAGRIIRSTAPFSVAP